MAHVSIEYAHIYGNERPSDEHYVGAALARLTDARLRAMGRQVTGVVLIDDYNVDNITLDVPEFHRLLSVQGLAPTWILSEASVVPAAQLLLDSLPARTRRSEIRYIASAGKVSCSLLVASWYLQRLGLLGPECLSAFALYGQAPLIAADRLVNIVHDRYRDVEERAARLISRTPFAAKAEAITNVYHDNRAAHDPERELLLNS